jgi:hypothetical protein
MVVIAVVDAQSKSKSDTTEQVKKSRWWKRPQKNNGTITETTPNHA